MAVQAFLVALTGSSIILLIGLQVGLLGSQLLPVGVLGYKSIRRLPEGGLDRAFISGDCRILSDFSYIELSF